MKKHLFLLIIVSCFATAGRAYVAGSGTFGAGTIAELEPGEYYVYYTDAQGVDRFLYAAGDNNWIVADEPKSVEITEGNVDKDNSGGVAYARLAYHMNSFGYFMSNCASIDGNGAIKTEPINGNNASSNRCWESQVFYKNNGKYAIRLTNCDSESWGANCFANTTGSQVFSSQPNLEDALYIWKVVNVYVYTEDIDALIMQASAFIAANPTIQCNVLTILQEQICNPAGLEALRNAFFDFEQYCQYSNQLQQLISQMKGEEVLNEATTTAKDVLYDALSTAEDLELAYEQYLQAIEATSLFNRDGDILWAYSESTNTLTLWGVGVGNMKNYNLNEAPWKTYAAQIQTIIVNDGVLNIGFHAFYNCSSLTSITIPESVTSIGDAAFEGCSSLTSITLPEGVTSIGRLAFWQCSSLTSIIIPEGVTSIGDHAFSDCSNLTTIILPETVTSIDRYAFAYCSGLTSIYIPESVTSIGDHAFYDCSNLTTIILPETVTSIDRSAFSGCSSLTSIYIPESVTSIGDHAFYDCSSLASITVDGDNTIYDSRNNCNAIVETTSNRLIVGCKSTLIPSNVTSIGDHAFYHCSGLTSITIPESVTSIGEFAFSGCSSLASITIPEGVTYIASDAFSSCSSLTSITIPESVTYIASDAFSSCSGLASISVAHGNPKYDNRDNCNAIIETASNTLIAGCKTTIIPSSVTSIEYYAFYKCSSLTSITIPEGVTSIGDLAFYDCNKLKVVINKSTLNITKGSSSYGYVGYYATIVMTNVDIVKEGDFWVEYTGGDKIAVYYEGKDKDVTIPDGITIIGDEVFKNKTNIVSVSIPNSVTSIGDYAFEDCNNLTNVTINCPVVGSWFSGLSLKSVTFSEKVTTIGANAFSGCSLYSVTIGAKVSSIGSNCFSTKPKKTIWLCNTPPTNYTNACGEVNYAANDQFIGLTNVKVYPQLSSLFVVDGIKYAIVSASERTCDAIDCVYDSTSANITIGETATYKKVSLKVKSVNDYTCYGNSFIQNANVGHEGNIGKNAFYDCDGLKTANINNNGSIGEYAFYSCNDLQAAEIGDGVSAIDANAFRNSMSLASVTLGSSIGTIGDYAFSGCTSLGSIVIPNSTTTLSSYCFSGDNALTAITIGTKVGIIYTYAFQNCSALSAISIPQSVATIGNYTFSGCSALKKITIEERETAISLGSNGSNPLFADCPLDTVFIGGKLSYQTGSSYGYSPFRNNTSLKSVTFNDRETTIYDREFQGCSGLQSVILGNGIASIGAYAFQNCSSLTSASLGSSIGTISDYAFSGCTSLESIEIPNSTTTLGGYCFSGDNSLADITIGTKVNTINAYAFQNCSALPAISIPQSVATIGNYTFSGCSALKEVVIEDRMSTLSLGSNGSSPLFANCPLDSVYIGGKISYNKTSSYGYSPFYRNLTLRAVTITDEEETIYDNEFYGCSALSTVAIGDGVKTIGNWAFSGCSSLDYFAFGTSVESIGNEAFSDCTAVTSIISRAMTPPTCGSEALDDIDKWECTLFVPEGYTDTYMAADQWKDFFFVEERDITDTYSTTLAAEYGTWIVPVDADIPEGLTVYSCTNYDGTALELTAVSSIEANKPYIVEGTPGETYSVTGIPRHSDDLTDGLLTGTYFSTEVTTGYVLQDGAEGVGFYRVGSHAITLSPNRCYLNLPAGSAPMFRIGGTTQIVNVGETQDDIVYDLFGRRVTDMNAKGVFIRNGKKIYVK